MTITTPSKLAVLSQIWKEEKSHFLVTQQKECERQKEDCTYMRVILGILAGYIVGPLERAIICAYAEP